MKLTTSNPHPKSNLLGYSFILLVAVLFGASPLLAHYNESSDDDASEKAPHHGVSQITADQQAVQDAIVADVLTDDSAYEFLGHLCDDHGGRLTGSAANEGALISTVEALRALGVNARLQTFKMPGWVRQNDEATMVAPLNRKLRATSLSYTQPHEPFEADVVDLGNGSDEALEGLDTQGKIGLLGPGARTRRGGYNEYAAELGLRGIIRTCRVSGGQLLCRTGSFEGKALEIPVYSVTQEEGKWMSRSLKRGQLVRVRLHTRSYCQEIDTANIVATFRGESDDTIIVGGHFDSWDLGQGAMDNGLGTAQLFAVAKALQNHAPKNKRTVELVWFNGEEQGLWGSRHHAPTVRDRPISAMINLDMVGWPKSVNALGFADMIPVLEGFDASLGERQLEKGVDNINWFGSDHTPYQLEGVRSITFGAPIDAEYVRYYHDFGDTFDKIDADMLKDASATIAALTYYLANVPELDNSRASDETVKTIFKSKALRERMRNSGMWRFGDDDEAEESPE